MPFVAFAVIQKQSCQVDSCLFILIMQKYYFKFLTIALLALGVVFSQTTWASQGANVYVPGLGRMTADDNGVWNILNTASNPQLLSGTYIVGAKTYSAIDWSTLFSTYGKNDDWLQLAAKFNLSIQVCPAKLVVEKFGTAVSSFTSVPLLRKTWENNCKDLKLGLSGVTANKNMGIELKLVQQADGTFQTSKIKYNGVEKTYTDEAWGTSKNLALYDAISGTQVGWDATAMYIFTVRAWDNVYNDIPGGQGQTATVKGTPLQTGGLSATLQIVVPPSSGADVARVTELQGDRGDIRLRLSGGTLPAYLGFTEVGKRTSGDHYTTGGQRIFGMFLNGERSDKEDFEITGEVAKDATGNALSDTRTLRMQSGPVEIKNFITGNKVIQKGRLARRTDSWGSNISWEYAKTDQDNLNNQLPVWIYSRDLGASTSGYEISLYQGGTMIFSDSGFGTALLTATTTEGFYIYNHTFVKVGSDYEVGQQNLTRYDRGRVYKLTVKNKQTGKIKDYITWPKNIEEVLNVQNQRIGLWSDTSHQLRGAGPDYNPGGNSFAMDDANLGNVGTWSTNNLFTSGQSSTVAIANASLLTTAGITPPTRTIREQTKWGTNLPRAVGTPFVSATRPVNSYVLQIYDVVKENYNKYCTWQGSNSISYLNSAIFGGDEQLKKAGISKRFSGTGLMIPITATQIRLNKVDGLGVTVSPTLVSRSITSILTLPNLPAHYSPSPNDPNVKYYVLDGATYDSDFIEGPSGTYYNRFDGKNLTSAGVASFDVSTLASPSAGCSYIVLYGSPDPYTSEGTASTISFEGYSWRMLGGAITSQRPTGLINYNGRVGRQNALTAKGDEAFTQENAFSDLTWAELRNKPRVPGAVGVLTRNLTLNDWTASVATGQIGFTWARSAEYASYVGQVPQNYQFVDASSFSNGQAGYVFYEIVKNGVSGGLQIRSLKDSSGVKFEALTVSNVGASDRVQLYIAYMNPDGMLSDVFMKEATGSSIDFRDEGVRPVLRMTDSNIYQAPNGQYNLTSPTANPTVIPTQFSHKAVVYSTSETDFCDGTKASATDPILKWTFTNVSGIKASNSLASIKINMRKKQGMGFAQIKEENLAGNTACLRLGSYSLDFAGTDLAFAVRGLDQNGLTSDWAAVGEPGVDINSFWGASTGASSGSSANQVSNYNLLPNTLFNQLGGSAQNSSTTTATAGKAYRPIALFTENNNLYYQDISQPRGTTRKIGVLRSPEVNPTYYPLTEYLYNQADDANNGQRAVFVTDGSFASPTLSNSCEGSAATSTRPVVLTGTLNQPGFKIIDGTKGSLLGVEFYLERQIPGTRNYVKIPGSGTEPPQIATGAQTPLTLTNPEQFKPGAMPCYQPNEDLISGNYRITVKAVSTEKNAKSPVAGDRTAYLKSDRMVYEFSVMTQQVAPLPGQLPVLPVPGASTGPIFIRPAGAFKKPIPACFSANPPCLLPININDVEYQNEQATSGKLAIIPGKKNPKIFPIWTEKDDQASIKIETSGVCQGSNASTVRPMGVVPASASAYDGFKVLAGGNIIGYEYVLQYLNGGTYQNASTLVKNFSQFTSENCYLPSNDLATGQYRLLTKGVLNVFDPIDTTQRLKSDIFGQSFDIINPNSGNIIIPTGGTAGSTGTGGTSNNPAGSPTNPPATFIPANP